MLASLLWTSLYKRVGSTFENGHASQITVKSEA